MALFMPLSAGEERTVPVVNYRLDGEIAVLTISSPPVNALSLAVRAGLLQDLQRAAQDPAVTALVVSGSGGMFSGGADITEIASGAALTAPMISDVQAQIEASSKPIVAAITGSALGGGFELTLTCHARTADPKAKVGLPEVKLGLIPGAGGTVRFTRLAGPAAALEAIVSGAQIPAERARELGLVDAVADAVVEAATDLARETVRERRPLRITSEMTERLHFEGRLFADFRDKLSPAARGQLAPWKIIEAVEAACTLPKEEALRVEREAFIACRDSPQRRALTHVFFAEREARRIPGLPSDVAPRPIHTAAVVGAGTMGGGIAMCFANSGI